MALVDYHNHTYLCGHASGSPDDYIQTAIDADLLEFGFSDHAPLPPGLREGITMKPQETEFYLNLIEQKKEEYKDDIVIKIGFELDFPLHESFDKRYLNDNRIDYIIGSCHFLGDWAFDHSDFIDEFDKRDIDEVYTEYYNKIIDIVQSGQINIIGHFDLIKKFGHRPKKNFKRDLENLADLISRRDIAVEINTAGLRKPVKEIYPSSDIIEILFNKNAPITLGSDSHLPEEVAYMFHKAVEIVKGIGYRKISGFSKKRYDIVL